LVIATLQHSTPSNLSSFPPQHQRSFSSPLNSIAARAQYRSHPISSHSKPQACRRCSSIVTTQPTPLMSLHALTTSLVSSVVAPPTTEDSIVHQQPGNELFYVCVCYFHLYVTNELATHYCSKMSWIFPKNVLSSLIYILLFPSSMNKVYCDEIVVFTHLMYARSGRPQCGRFTSWNHISLWHSLIKNICLQNIYLFIVQTQLLNYYSLWVKCNWLCMLLQLF